MDIPLRYGRRGLIARLPDKNVRHVLRLNPAPPLPDVTAATRHALRQPLGAKPLRELAAGRGKVCLVLPDNTRPLPCKTLLPPILEELARAGVGPERILLLIATGLHRVATEADLLEMLGPEIVSTGYRIESHQARDTESHACVGRSRRGTSLWIDHRYLEADLRLLVSLIEPHLFAGYSGGRKMILPGLASEETICHFHSPELIEQSKSAMGLVHDNPTDQEAWEAYHLAGGAAFSLACTLDEERRVTGVWAGDTRETQIAGMRESERASKVVIDEPVDVVVTSNAGYPLDRVFYQGLKAITVGGRIVRPGGIIIVAQENEEGLGNEEFADLILSVDECHAWVQCALEQGGPHQVDGWAIHQIEMPLRQARVLNYSSLPRDLHQRLLVEPIESVEAGVEQALATLGPDATIAVIPEGPYVLPCLKGEYLAEHSVDDMMR
ncbi:MAG: nickel-dependent lactate racemase [candidate division WS1 bacterium]|nr:nickel-dependent lactate racemase [candidate division WS1 bacterium]